MKTLSFLAVWNGPYLLSVNAPDHVDSKSALPPILLLQESCLTSLLFHCLIYNKNNHITVVRLSVHKQKCLE